MSAFNKWLEKRQIQEIAMPAAPAQPMQNDQQMATQLKTVWGRLTPAEQGFMGQIIGSSKWHHLMPQLTGRPAIR